MDLFARFVGILMVSVFYIAVGVEGVAYDATCTGSDAGNCAETNNICDATTLKCACSTTSFRKDGTECATKIALDAACTASQPSDQCTDSNAECDSTSSNTCVCKTNYFKDTSSACAAQIALNANCDSTESSTDQCAGSHVECRDDSGTDKCLCKTTHFDSSGTCTTRIAFGQPCSNTVTATNQCVAANQACSLESGTTNYKCQCTAAYYADGSSTCVARKKPDETCAANECVEHATCNTGSSPTKCECDAGYTATPTTTPTMCSGVVKFATLSYMYVVPILVSMMFLLR